MASDNRFNVLDGWRAISILLVLLCHLFPVGPKAWHLGVATGVVGMSLFFTLSGFLVTHMLLRKPLVIGFLIRRLFRILPLSWAYMLVVFIIYPSSWDTILAHFGFYANFPPKPLIPHITDHLWSLCVEVQFYLGIALLVALLRKRGLYLIPLISIFFTFWRVKDGMGISVITQYRVDEILAGGILALAFNGDLGLKIQNFLSRSPTLLLVPLLLISSHPDIGWPNYFRPYLAALLVGSTLFQPNSKISELLGNKIFFYIASISYALYIVHPLLASTYLGTGNIVEKYSKRPLLLIVVFAVAHLSTYHFEKHAISLGKKLSSRLTPGN